MLTVEETVSTNADLKAMADSGLAEGSWLRAERQSGGRGRLGRVWESPRGNLYCSTIVRLRPDDPPPQLLSLVAGIALFDTVNDFISATPMLKWPNDLLLAGAKMAGILTEMQGRCVVVGIGLNIASAPQLPDRRTAFMAEHMDTPPPGPALVLDALAAHFARVLVDWRTQGREALRSEWCRRAHPVGWQLEVKTGQQEAMAGEFHGLTLEGALKLKLANGALVDIPAGDVELAGESRTDAARD